MHKRSSIFLSAISGNILEYYDFTVYAVFSIAIGEAFFPGDSSFVKTFWSLVVFATGFITRPFGGIIFGYIADRHGRRVSLIISMLGMTFPTLVIGFIPEYKIIGYYAPAILVLMRLLQGLCISGEGAGAAIFLLEHYQNLRSGLISGIVHASNIAGTLLATLIGIILAYFFPETKSAWRFAFLLGGILGLIGFYLRLKVAETPIFIQLAQKKKTLKAPFLHVWKNAKTSLLVTGALGACASSVTYMMKTYINIYHCDVLHYHDTLARSLTAYTAIITMIIMPISGHLADSIGRFRTISLAAVSVFLLVFPCFYLLSCQSMWQQIAALTLLAFLGGAIAGSAYIFIISLFTPEQRFSGVAFSYNLGIAMFGGTSPAIARWLLEVTGQYYSPAYYIMFISGSFLLILYLARVKIRELLDINLKQV